MIKLLISNKVFRMNKRIFVTHVAPMEIGIKLGVSVAATNFSFNLAKGVHFDKVYSILPAFISYRNKVDFLNDIFDVQFSIFRKLQFSRIAALWEQFRLFRMIPKHSNVWLYNVTALNGYLIKLLRIFKPSVKIFPIILDFTPDDSKCEKWLSLINSCDGRIMLSDSDLFNKNNSICLPGIVPNKTHYLNIVENISYDFLISGQLTENISMLSDLLDIFKDLPIARLHITGEPTEKAKRYSEKYSNIICYGQLKYNEFLHILNKCPFLLSTRNPKYKENFCNFPSKIIEGLTHNRIIISTIKYPQLEDINYIQIDSENLRFGIESILKMSADDIKRYTNQSHMTFTLFNPNVWDKAMTKIELDAR